MPAELLRTHKMSIHLQVNSTLLIVYLSTVALSAFQGACGSFPTSRMQDSPKQQLLQSPCNCSSNVQAALRVFTWQGVGKEGDGGIDDIKLSQKPHIYVRYSACLGLANQLYSHITALALAARLGADLFLAPATHRSSFKHAFNSADAQWKTAATSTILDVDSIISFWRQRGVTIHRVSHCTLLWACNCDNMLSTACSASWKIFSFVQAPYKNNTVLSSPKGGVESQLVVHPDLQIALGTPAFAPMKDICSHVHTNIARSLNTFRMRNAKRNAEAVLVEFACVFHMLQTVR